MTESSGVRSLEFTAMLPAHPVSVAVARSIVRGLRSCVDPHRLDRLELIVSEAVTNALRHGSRAHDVIGMRLAVNGGGVTGWVDDNGPAFTISSAHPAPDQVGGFGLHIVNELARSWALERSERGNIVSFTV